MRLPTKTVRRAAVIGALAAVVIAPSAAASGATGTPKLAAQAAAASCPLVHWGSLPKVDNSGMFDTFQGKLTNIRAGRHACFDRLVFDIRDDPDALDFDVRYVAGPVVIDGSGDSVPVTGGATIQILLPGNTVVDGETLTYRRGTEPNVASFRTFRQIAYAGNFEGVTTVALGVRARLPMRVFQLDGPQDLKRLVIDVRHQWTSF